MIFILIVITEVCNDFCENVCALIHKHIYNYENFCIFYSPTACVWTVKETWDQLNICVLE